MKISCGPVRPVRDQCPTSRRNFQNGWTTLWIQHRRWPVRKERVPAPRRKTVSHDRGAAIHRGIDGAGSPLPKRCSMSAPIRPFSPRMGRMRFTLPGRKRRDSESGHEAGPPPPTVRVRNPDVWFTGRPGLIAEDLACPGQEAFDPFAGFHDAPNPPQTRNALKGFPSMAISSFDLITIGKGGTLPLPGVDARHQTRTSLRKLRISLGGSSCEPNALQDTSPT